MKKIVRQLILCPRDENWQAEITYPLQKLGLLGGPVTPEKPDHYLIGDQFLQHVSFMGCSPTVEFEPASGNPIAWDNFIFVYLPAPTKEPVWLADRQMAKPACPDCEKRTVTWQSEKGLIHCKHCDTASSVCAWNWFDAGGCARQFICIVNVFPRESIPADHFLQQLAKLTGTNWRYFYVDAPLPGY